MEEVILNHVIETMDEFELAQLEIALIKARKRLFPEWETIIISLPENDLKERRRIMDRCWEMLMSIEDK